MKQFYNKPYYSFSNSWKIFLVNYLCILERRMPRFTLYISSGTRNSDRVVWALLWNTRNVTTDGKVRRIDIRTLQKPLPNWFQTIPCVWDIFENKLYNGVNSCLKVLLKKEQLSITYVANKIS